MHVPQHWILVHQDETKKVMVFDSMGEVSKSCLITIKKAIEFFLKYVMGSPDEAFIQNPTKQVQFHSNNCAMFVCLFAIKLASKHFEVKKQEN